MHTPLYGPIPRELSAYFASKNGTTEKLQPTQKLNPFSMAACFPNSQQQLNPSSQQPSTIRPIVFPSWTGFGQQQRRTTAAAPARLQGSLRLAPGATAAAAPTTSTDGADASRRNSDSSRSEAVDLYGMIT